MPKHDEAQKLLVGFYINTPLYSVPDLRHSLATSPQALPPALQLVSSPLLQGFALSALQALFSALAAVPASAAPPASCSSKALLVGLLQAGAAGEAGRQVQVRRSFGLAGVLGIY